MSLTSLRTERRTWIQQQVHAPLDCKVAIDTVAIYVFEDNPTKQVKASGK